MEGGAQPHVKKEMRRRGSRPTDVQPATEDGSGNPIGDKAEQAPSPRHREASGEGLLYSFNQLNARGIRRDVAVLAQSNSRFLPSAYSSRTSGTSTVMVAVIALNRIRHVWIETPSEMSRCDALRHIM